jgi:hypothetical protein
MIEESLLSEDTDGKQTNPKGLIQALHEIPGGIVRWLADNPTNPPNSLALVIQFLFWGDEKVHPLTLSFQSGNSSSFKYISLVDLK